MLWFWIGFVVFVLLMLGRVRRSRVSDQAEDVAHEDLTFGGNSLRRGWRRLRNLARLVRRYGLGSQLLAAISVQNLYANLTRLARQRGFARPPAVAPDEYLPILHQAFPGQDVALQRLTLAYMRVYDGDHPINESELAQLRADFRAIQAMPRRGHKIPR